MEMKCDKKHIKQRSCHFEHDFHSRTFFVPFGAYFAHVSATPMQQQQQQKLLLGPLGTARGQKLLHN